MPGMARFAPRDEWLATALATIDATGATGKQRRRLEQAAFGTSLRGGKPVEEPKQIAARGSIRDQESLLVAASEALGYPPGKKIGIGNLKRNLRLNGDEGT